MLTKKQKNLLLFINKKLRSSGVSPSYEEMKISLNLKSKSGIHRLISALEERGFIKRLAHKARALEVIKLPETASANDIYNSFSPSVIRGGLDINNSNKNSEVSVLGDIAAGTQIEAIQNEVSRIPLPENIEKNGASIFMYHRFDETKYPSTNTNINQLEKHLSYVTSNNFNIETIDEILKKNLIMKNLLFFFSLFYQSH